MSHSLSLLIVKRVRLLPLSFLFSILCAQLQTQMITTRCWWPAGVTCPSRSLPQPSPTTFCWALCWSTCASSTRAIQHAHVCCLKVCTEMKWQLVWRIIHYTFIHCFVVSLTVIGQRLAAMNLLSPLAISDEFSTIRLQHNRAFTELLHAASSSLYPQVTKSSVCLVVVGMLSVWILELI